MHARSSILAAALLLVGLISIAPQPACGSVVAMHTTIAQDTLVLIVEDHTDLDDQHEDDRLFIATSANNWQPGLHEAGALLPPTDDRPRAFRFEIPYPDALHPDFRFKFTRGTWDTVETRADGHYLPNRDLVDDLRDRPDTVTLALHAFADRRPAIPSTVVGDLRVIEIDSAHTGRTRVLRVWLPEGYEQTTDTYPVLYMHDGQNCFDQETSAFGMEWEVDETLTQLIGEGALPPMIVVAIDNAGAQRSWEYNAPEIVFQGKPGRADTYLRCLTEEIMPAVEARFRVKTGPEHTALAGSSFGGNVTLYCLMRAPNLFGQALIESPAIRTVGPDFERLLLDHPGPWPERLVIGMGTRETGDPARDPIYARSADVLAEHLRQSGLDDTRLRVVVEEGAQHNEPAWARRFPGAARFLWGRPESAPSP